MDYRQAKEIMGLLIAAGVNAAFADDSETIINVYDDEGGGVSL